MGSARLTVVSIVIPCYNHAQFLAEAIESAMSQTHPRVEIVVVDDGSTDDTARVAARYPNLKYIWQENAGLSAARNSGLASSTGEYVIFLDADDRLLPGAVEAGLMSMNSPHQPAMVYGRFSWIDSDGNLLGVSERHEREQDEYLALLRGNHIGMNGTVLFRRKSVEDVGGFDPGLPACEDYDLYLRLARRHPVGRHGEMVAEYRRHNSNMSSDKHLVASSAIRALSRQRRYVGVDAKRRRALAEGMRYWIETYGTDHLWPALQGRLRGGGRERIDALTLLLRHAPMWTARRTLRAGLRKLVTLPERLASTNGISSSVPAVGNVRFGDLRRLQPLDRYFGYQRGTPIDRFYIERFLEENRADIRGRVLEIKDATYTRRFGDERVSLSEVLDTTTANPVATIIGDLSEVDALPETTFDCVLLTQTLQYIYDFNGAVDNVFRSLKPQGTLLLSVPCISKTDDEASWYWMFTEHSIHTLLEIRVPRSHIEVRSYGNALAATAFLQGIAAEELKISELEFHDKDYAVCIVARATRPENNA